MKDHIYFTTYETDMHKLNLRKINVYFLSSFGLLSRIRYLIPN